MPGFTRLIRSSSWRKLALGTWAPPSDPTIYAPLDLDVSRAQPWLERVRAATGVKVTFTHLVGKAVALAIARRPEVNVVVRRRRHLYQRSAIDVFFQVAFDAGEDLAGAKVSAADQKHVVEIARELQERAARLRAHEHDDTATARKLMAATPAVLRGPLLRALEGLTYDLGLDLSAVGVPYDSFGSAMVTSLGGFGLTRAFAPLVPFSRAPIVIAVGAVEPKPVAVEGRVEVRPVLPVGVTLDHRVVDGFQAGQMAAVFRGIVEDPAGALGEPD
jgi:pyruvate dehydrogenase E2 component (dihydrolipoamide acetyltransferase)